MSLYKSLPKNDFDQTIKMNGTRVACYSKKKMKELYPQETYSVVGELHGKKFDSPIGYYQVGGKQFGMTKHHDLNRIIYREAGFACVGQDQYLVILKNRWPIILWIAGILATLCVGTAIIVGMLGSDDKIPDSTEQKNPLPSIDPNAQQVTNDGSDNTTPQDPNASGENNQEGSVSLMYTLDASMSLSDGKIEMFFVNPHNSNHDVVLEMFIVTDDGSKVSIAKSGRIPVGMGVTEMEFNRDSAILSAGSYQAMYSVYPYDPITGELSIVNMDVTDVNLIISN